MMLRLVLNVALRCTLRKKQGENGTKTHVEEDGELVSRTGKWNMSASAFLEEAQL
jgi:hypothetical protein